MLLSELAEKIGASEELTERLISDYGVDVGQITDREVQDLAKLVAPAPLTTTQTTMTKAKPVAKPVSNKLTKSLSNKLADRSPVVAEVPNFSSTRQEDLGLAQVEADGYAVGHSDISAVMASARRGYAMGAQVAFEEGAIESSNFRKQVLSAATSALFG